MKMKQIEGKGFVKVDVVFPNGVVVPARIKYRHMKRIFIQKESHIKSWYQFLKKYFLKAWRWVKKQLNRIKYREVEKNRWVRRKNVRVEKTQKH